MRSDDECASRLDEIEAELSEIESEVRRLRCRQRELRELKESLRSERDLRTSNELAKRDWDGGEFEWSERVRSALSSVFGVESFRAQQLSAINATLSKKHAIVVMPTGAGKSLCYQLPAVVEDGVTVVVSPLISLMEDQVMSLTGKRVPARLMSSASAREDVASALEELVDANSPLKLLYVTPERFAKSKRFMSKLQKCFAEGRLRRIAIDEVHCCSQWGHDFRPDYKFLGVLSAMFPNVPILGLTATATARVLVDVQKMLDIRGCLLIRSTFDRPNLFYQIISKPSSSEECVATLHGLLSEKYRDESGIIYATSVKDCVDLTSGLRERGLRVACYHANLEPAQRSSIHVKWMQKRYQAIVATVAFGLGIDKPDVRFVIHHSLSKAMESYYQESGRAGRDGRRAECIMMYRMQDIFRLSTMVFSSAGSLDHLYGMVKYCLDPYTCRRKIIAKHFNEERGEADCNGMCDRCYYDSSESKDVFIQDYCLDIYRIITNASKNDVKLTAQKIIDSWYGKGPAKLRVPTVLVPKLSRIKGEAIIAFLLVEGYLKEDFHFTAYTTISYIKIGQKSDLLENNKQFKIKMTLRDFNKLDCDTSALKDFVYTSDDSKTLTDIKSCSREQKKAEKRKISHKGCENKKTKLKECEPSNTVHEIVISD